MASVERRNSSYVYILPALFGLIFIILYPFAYNVYISFTNMSVFHFKQFSFVGLKNYAFVFTDPDFVRILENTVIWTFGNVIPHVTIGLVLAFVLNSKIRGKSVYRLFLIVPWAMPSFITLLIWRGMFNYQYGVINALLAQVGVPAINWLGNCTWAFVAMVIANVWLGFPFMMIIFSGAMQSIPTELYEAASLDGAVGFRQMRYVTIPMIRPTILIATLLGSIWTFNNFNAGFLVTGGGPGVCTTIFIVQAYNLAFTSQLPLYALAATYAFIAFAMLFLPGLFWTRYTGLTRQTT